MKKAVGKRLGDTVHVVLEKFLEMLYYIRREEINKIEWAERDETRSKRLQALIAKLVSG